MLETTNYAQIIIDLFHQYDQHWGNSGGLENKIIVDRDQQAFVFITFGWQNTDHYTHLLCFHLEIIGGKIWVHENNTDVMIAVDLIDKGVHPEDIVLGFVEPQSPYLPIVY